MSRLTTHANMDFCVLNAQSVCVFACKDFENTAYTTVWGGGRTLVAQGFSLFCKCKGGDAMCP